MSELPPPKPTLIDRVSRKVGEWCSYLFLICMLIIAYEVVARYGANAPTVWAHDLTTALCAVGFLLAGVYTQHRRAHIRITVLYDRMPGPLRHLSDIVGAVITLAFLGLLGWEGIGQAGKALAIMETAGTASQIPLPTIIKCALVLAAGLMALQVLADLVRMLRGGAARPPPA